MCAEPSRIPPASTSSFDGGKQIPLVVTTGDSATEIFVIDGHLQLCARDIGKLETKLIPGIYKVRVRTGLSTQEDYVILQDSPVTKQFAALPFSSPVPLVNTAKSHEYHQKAAIEFSKQVHIQAGAGSSIFVFARDWTPSFSRGEGALPPADDPSAGLRLKSLDGTVIADIAQSSIKSRNQDPDPTLDPWAACTIAIDPGPYRLGVQTPNGEFEQLIIAPPNWHAHVFLLQRSYGEDHREKRPDLGGGAIMLSRFQQFTPNDNEARLVELARLGLIEQRKVLSSDLRQMLTGKFSDPMLGIFAGHLMLTDPSPDLNLLSIVVGNLRSLLGVSHPDVEALALKVNAGKVEVRVPPMLRRSWSIILDASSDEKAMVARQSFAAEIIGRIRSSDPWLIWSAPGTTAADEEEHANVDALFKQVLTDHLSRIKTSEADAPEVRRTTALAEAAASWDHSEADKDEDSDDGGAYESAGFAHRQSGGAESAGAAYESAAPEASKPSAAAFPESSKAISKTQVKELIHALGVPRFYVEDLLKESGFNPPQD